jgi:hypothetical protein
MTIVGSKPGSAFEAATRAAARVRRGPSPARPARGSPGVDLMKPFRPKFTDES